MCVCNDALRERPRLHTYADGPSGISFSIRQHPVKVPFSILKGPRSAIFFLDSPIDFIPEREVKREKGGHHSPSLLLKDPFPLLSPPHAHLEKVEERRWSVGTSDREKQRSMGTRARRVMEYLRLEGTSNCCMHH